MKNRGELKFSFTAEPNALLFWEEYHSETCPCEALSLFLYLVHSENQDGYASRRYEDIQAKFSWGRSRVSSALRWLLENKIITKQFRKSDDGRQQSNRYRIKWDRIEELDGLYRTRKPSPKINVGDEPSPEINTESQNQRRLSPEINVGKVPKSDPISKNTPSKNENALRLSGGGGKSSEVGGASETHPPTTTTTTKDESILFENEKQLDGDSLSILNDPVELETQELDSVSPRPIVLEPVKETGPLAPSLCPLKTDKAVHLASKAWHEVCGQAPDPRITASVIKKLSEGSKLSELEYQLALSVEKCKKKIASGREVAPGLFIEVFEKDFAGVRESLAPSPTLTLGTSICVSLSRSNRIEEAYIKFEEAFGEGQNCKTFIDVIFGIGFGVGAQYLGEIKGMSADEAETFIQSQLLRVYEMAKNKERMACAFRRSIQTSIDNKALLQAFESLVWPDWTERQMRIVDAVLNAPVSA